MENSRTKREEVQLLFVRHANVIRGYILALLADRQATEDVLQETFLTISENADGYRTGSKFTAWARATARLKVLEHLRRSKRWPAALSPAAIEALAEAADEFDDEWEPREAALRLCVEHLPLKSRELIRLRYSAENPSLDAIARRVGWTVGAVKVALSRARSALLDCVSRRLSAGEVSGGT